MTRARLRASTANLGISLPAWTMVALSLVALAPSACQGDEGGASEAGSSGDGDGDGDGDLECLEYAADRCVEVGADGSLRLVVGGRRELGLGPAGPIARTFDETYAGLTAIWDITRTDEVETRLDTRVSVEATAAGVVATWTTTDGARTATLTISDEGVDGVPATRLQVVVDGAADSLALPVVCDQDGTFHGFGAQYNATNQRGERFPLIVGEQGIGRDPEVVENGAVKINGDEHTTYFPMPWWVDARGFGVLVRTDRRVDVDLCASDASTAWIESISSDPLELTVVHGPTPKQVVTQLGALVGRPMSPPDWAFGPWVAAQGGRDVVLAEVDALEAAGVPFTAVWVQDWTGIRMNLDGGFGVNYRWRADETLYPELADMIAEIQAKGYRFLGYANPFVPTNLDHFPEMDPEGTLIQRDGATYTHLIPSGSGSHPDFSDPAAVAYVEAELAKMVTDYGMDGWMADFAEWAPLDATYDDGADPIAHHNRYPIDWHARTRAVFDELRPDGDWVSFARSGWTGVHAVASVHWIGDQECDWSEFDGLPTVVPAMVNLGLSGIPIATHDIAGFSGGPSDKALFMRWTELGAFTPIMRTHDGNKKMENWRWNDDAESEAHFVRFAKIHAALQAELEQWRDEAEDTSIPIVRHLMLEFPEDVATWDVSDAFMLGDTWLVAPITTEGATQREVYLPDGATWFHTWTGDAYDGGQTIVIDAPVGSPPVFSRDEDRPALRQIQ